MANTVAYPDLALKKIYLHWLKWRPDSVHSFANKKISFTLGSRPATIDSDEQTAYDDRRKALFLRSPAAEWFDSLEAALAWKEENTVYCPIHWWENAVLIPNLSG